MAAKKTKAYERFAPDPGSDAEFDGIEEKVWASIVASGGEEAETLAPARELAASTGMAVREAAREILAEKLVKHGGKSYRPGTGSTKRPGIDYPIEDEDVEPEQVVTFTIPPRPTDPYWYDDPKDARMLDHYILARRELGNHLHGALLITGHAGSGKSEGVPHGIARINREHGLSLRMTRMNCPTVTDPGKWFGRREADKDGTRFVKSDFVEAVERGDVILLDEIMRLHPSIHNPIMTLLDGSEEVTLSDLNVTITRHPETTFIATTNIGVQYGGTHRLDWAMRERFSWTIERDWPPPENERRILTSRFPVSDDKADTLVDIARKTRDMYQAGDLRNVISTRTLVNAAFLVGSGSSIYEAMAYSALPLFDGDASGIVGAESDRQRVAAVLEGRLGRG